MTAHDIATQCADGIGDTDLAARVRAAHPQFIANSDRLRDAVIRDALHALDLNSFVVEGLSDLELVTLYTGQLAKLGRPARRLYNTIIKTARYGRCSYCQHGKADTLDHVLPKSRVAGLAIDPWNLVPCCSHCNHKLGAAHSSAPEKQFLHPYAMPEIGGWLAARVTEYQVPVTVEFFAAPDHDLEHILQQRITHQFDKLGLAGLFAVVSAEQLTTTGRNILKRLPGAPSSVVREYLLELAEDAGAAGPNSRRAVVFEALGHSDWYCSHGFAAE